MKSNEVLREVLQDYGFKRAAVELGISESCLYKWCDPDGGKANGVLNPMERVILLYRLTGDRRLIQWFCEQAGGYFVPNPPPAPAPQTLLAAENQMQHELLEFMGGVTAAAAKGKVTATDAVSFRARWEQAKTVTEGFVTGAERGIYRLGAFFFPAIWFATTGELPELVEV